MLFLVFAISFILVYWFIFYLSPRKNKTDPREHCKHPFPPLSLDVVEIKDTKYF